MLDIGVEPVVDEAQVWEEVEAVAEGRARMALETDAEGFAVAPQPWRIESLGAAGWAMAKLAEVRARRMEYDEEVRRWKEAGAKLARAEAFFEERLIEWGVRSRTALAKSFPLSHGKVSTRKANARIVVVNDDAAIEWAEQHCPDAVKVTKALLVSKLPPYVIVGGETDTDPLRVVTADGEVIPGLSGEPERVTASVSVEVPALHVTYRHATPELS